MVAETSIAGDDDSPRALANVIYDTLRQRVILGDLAPGTRLTEQKLADELAVSRIPLREAISRLANDNLVTTMHRRSAVVTSWTSSDIHDLFDARIALETSAAARAARRASGVTALEAALSRSEQEMAANDALGFAESNVRFHVALVAAAGNPLLDGLMRSIASRMTWLFYLTAGRDAAVACREHGAIVAAVRDGHPRLAESLVYSHIEAGRAPSLTIMSQPEG